MFLQPHPDFTHELRAFFVDFDRLQLTKMQPARNAEATIVPLHDGKPGSEIAGRYKLLENIGEGGMVQSGWPNIRNPSNAKSRSS